MTRTSRADALRLLPSVSRLVLNERVRDAARGVREDVVLDIARAEVDAVRREILALHETQPPVFEDIVDRVVASITLLMEVSPRTVINGTGIIIQTNLGRAPVSRATAEAMAEASRNYVALEVTLEDGLRGGRGRTIENLIRALTGAERTIVVNNNAAAVLLTLAALAAGKRVIVSRGELVEIGGGFRIPDVLRQSGAVLTEVGTTNRTYVSDYDAATDSETAALLKVHASNFAITGFTASVSPAELAEVAHQHGILAIEDAGSGCLRDTRPFGMAHEPLLSESIAAGMDVVCASGDKLFGGPQAGIICGRREVIDRISHHPLARAVRADKTALAGIAATLQHYIRGEELTHIPVWRSIAASASDIERRVRHWQAIVGPRAEVLQTEAAVGGGSLPGETLPSFALGLRTGDRPEELSRRLRTAPRPIMPRIVDDVVAIDGRTVLPDEDSSMIETVQKVLSG